jgi:lipopolysaccharide biosynthesis regulator YciM
MPRIPVTNDRGWYLANKAEKKDATDPANK